MRSLISEAFQLPNHASYKSWNQSESFVFLLRAELKCSAGSLKTGTLHADFMKYSIYGSFLEARTCYQEHQNNISDFVAKTQRKTQNHISASKAKMRWQHTQKNQTWDLFLLYQL